MRTIKRILPESAKGGPHIACTRLLDEGSPFAGEVCYVAGSHADHNEDSLDL